MGILWYIVQKIGCFSTLICPWKKAGKCIFRPPRNPKTQNFPSGFKHGGAYGRHYIKQIICQSKIRIAMPFLEFGSPANDVKMSSVSFKTAWCIELFTWKPCHFLWNIDKFCYTLFSLILWRIWEELILVYSFLLLQCCQL